MTGALVDVGSLERWAEEALPGSGRLGLEPIVGGASNEMFAVRRGEHRWVLRRPPRHKVAASAHDVLREVRVLRALDGSGIPHPGVVGVCEDTEVIGAPFYVMEFVEGFTPRDPLPAPFDTDSHLRREMAFALVDGLAAVHAVDWRAAGLEGFGKPEGFLERQVSRWLGQLARYRTRDIPGLDFVAGWLEENRPRMGEPAIIHGDYQFINVMVAPEPPARLTAIVDWEQSTIGDPLLDLGWLLASWTDPGEDELRFGSKYLTDRRGFPARAELAERYASATGRALDRLEYYVVLSLFKLACVLEGSYHRFVTGKSDDPQHRRLADLVPALIRQAEACARGGAP